MNARTRTLMLSAATFVMSACAGDGGLTTAAHQGAGLEVLVSSGSVGQLTDTVFIGNIPTPTSKETCPSVTVDVALAGNALKPRDIGGWNAPGPLCISGCDTYCAPWTWESDARPPPADTDTTAVTVNGGGRAWTMTVQHLYAQRTVTLMTSGPVHAGDTVTLQTSPATDDLTHGFGEDIYFSPPAQPGTGFQDDAPVGTLATLSPGSVTFTVPSGLAPGTYDLELMFQSAPHVVTCVGPAYCLASNDGERQLCDAAGSCGASDAKTLQLVVQ
jgi:hypothetical protein